MAATKQKSAPEATEVKAPAAEQIQKIIPKEVDLNQYISVRNGFQGKLIYKSSRTGEKFVWDEFGSEQEIELKELRNAKNSSKAFFINNWFMFDDDWVIDFLGVRNFYKNAIKLDEFDTIFSLTPAEIKKKVSKLSPGQKKSVAYRAMEMVANGEIDSLKVITALEESLGIELIEK